MKETYKKQVSYLYTRTRQKEKTPQVIELVGFVCFLSPFVLGSQRRERDSNPRSLAAQRFSRPPQSTTLPSLLAISLKMRVQR